MELYDPVIVTADNTLGWVIDVRGGPEGIHEYLIATPGPDSESHWYRETELGPRGRPTVPSIGTYVRCYGQDCEVLGYDYAAYTVDLLAAPLTLPPNNDSSLYGRVQQDRHYPAVPQALLAMGQGEIPGTTARFSDGARLIQLPDYVKLTFTSAIGTWADPENGDLRVHFAAADSIVEVHAIIQLQSNRDVILAYAWEQDPPTELGRVTLSSNNQERIVRSCTLPMQQSGLLSMYLSADTDIKMLSWDNGQLIVHPA